MKNSILYLTGTQKLSKIELDWQEDPKNKYLVSQYEIGKDFDFRLSIVSLIDTPGALSVIDLYTDKFKMNILSDLLNKKGFETIYVDENHSLAPEYGEAIIAYIYDSSVRDAKISCEWFLIEFERVIKELF